MLPPPSKIPPLGAPPASPRQRVLAQWRGFDVAPLDKGHADRSKSVGSLIPQVLKSVRIDQRRAEAEVIKVWNHLLEADVVAHAQPTGLHKGTLFVNVDSSVWLSEIVRYRRKEILDRLQHSFGTQFIARISFRVG